MSVSNYQELATHVGHEIEVADWGRGANVAVGCLTCGEILLDYDNEITLTVTIADVPTNDAEQIARDCERALSGVHGGAVTVVTP